VKKDNAGQGSFLRNLFRLQLLNWAVKPLWILGVETLVQNALGEAVYGAYFVVFNFSLLFTIALDFGMNSLITRELAAGISASALWNRSLRLKAAFSILYLVVTGMLGLAQGMEPALLTAVLFSQIGLQWILFFRAYLQGTGHSRPDAWFSIADRLGAMLIILVLLRTGWMEGSRGLFTFAISQTLSYCLVAMVAFAFVRRLLKRGGGETASQVSARSILKQGAGLALLSLLMVFYTRIDALLLRWLHADGYYQAGLYARGFRLLDAALIFPILLSTLLLPAFSDADEKGNQRALNIAGLSTRLLLAMTAAVAFAAHRWGSDISQVLNPKGLETEHRATGEILAWLLTAWIPMSLIYVYGTWLTAKRKIRLLNLLAGGTLLLNIALNIWLIPDFGAEAAAWNVLISQGLFALGCAAASAITGIRQLPGLVLRPLAGIGFLFFLSELLGQTAWQWYWQAMAGLGAYGLLILLSGYLPLKGIRLNMQEAGPE
jgi:O-antigen/teichoic acid export membrane protein